MSKTEFEKIIEDGLKELGLEWPYEEHIYEININMYNKLAKKTENLANTSIGGGINLEPKHFTIKKTPTSAKLNQFQIIAKQTDVKWGLINNAEEWIRSRTKKGGSYYKQSLPKKEWTSESVFKSKGSSFEHSVAGKQQSYWVSTNGGTNSWRDLFKFKDLSYRERMFDGSSNVIHIAEYKSEKLSSYITGTMIDDNRIVFSKSTRKDLIKPEEPPIWWSFLGQ